MFGKPAAAVECVARLWRDGGHWVIQLDGPQWVMRELFDEACAGGLRTDSYGPGADKLGLDAQRVYLTISTTPRRRDD